MECGEVAAPFARRRERKPEFEDEVILGTKTPEQSEGEERSSEPTPKAKVIPDEHGEADIHLQLQKPQGKTVQTGQVEHEGELEPVKRLLTRRVEPPKVSVSSPPDQFSATAPAAEPLSHRLQDEEPTRDLLSWRHAYKPGKKEASP